MIKKYRLKEFPQQVVQVISVSELSKVVDENGFLLVMMNAVSDEEINDFVDVIGAYDIPVPVIVSNNKLDVHEVVENIENNA